MNKEISTVKELIEQALEHPIDTGATNTRIFALPGFENYLLKIGRESFRYFEQSGFALSSTSSLTPIHFPGVEGRNYGQPILRYDDPVWGVQFDIVMKKPGESLGSIEHKHYLEYQKTGLSPRLAQLAAYKDILKLLVDLPGSAFTGLMQDINHLSSCGIWADTQFNNILISGKTLGLIDIDTPIRNPEDRTQGIRRLPAISAAEYAELPNKKNNLENLKLALFSTMDGDDEECRTLKSKLGQKIKAAAQRAQFPATEMEAASHHSGIAFRGPARIQGVGILLLSNLADFRHTIRQIENRLGISFY